MGTRNLIAVKSEGEYKIAQYGQWDGYPGGQGVDVLNFLKTYKLDIFKEKLKNCSFIENGETDDEIKALGDRWERHFPQLSRDTGYKVLGIVYDSKEKIKLADNIDFAGESLFCEWAYVIDFDKNTLEVFQGYNKTPLKENERFFNIKKGEGEYYQIRIIKEYKLDNLPDEKAFLDDFRNDEDEE